MADANSDSDDGVYCELKEHIKLARMNLRKVKKRETVADKEDQDSENNENADGDLDARTEEHEDLVEEPIDTSEDLDAENIFDKEDVEIEVLKGSNSEQESDVDCDIDNQDESIADKTLTDHDDEVGKCSPNDAIESDKEDIANSDNDGEIEEVEHEVILSDEQSDKGQHDESNIDEIHENNRDSDKQNSDNDEEQNNESESDDETADSPVIMRSVKDLKNCFESRIVSTSSTGVYRSFEPTGSDYVDQNINVVGEETIEIEDEIYGNMEKQNTDDELKATDDESSTVDAFNIQYRYGLRYSKSMRRSQQPSEEINDPNNVKEAEEDVIDSEIIEDSMAYNVDGRMSTYNEHLQIAQATIERLYDFIFHDPWEVLNQILDSKRSSKSSTEVDGIMSSPQQIFYTNEESIKEKIDESELEENIENAAEVVEKVDLRLNTRALSKDAKTYELERFDKNILIIFNQERIAGYKPRLGTRQDVESLTQTFSPYGFDVVEHLDLNRDEIFEELKRLTEMNFTNYGCLAIAVLTHGTDMDGLRAKDRLYYQNDIIKYLKTSENPTLVTKPKVLIIQACRGSESTYAVTVGKVGKITKDYDDIDEHRTYTLPVEADILIVHSTFAGKTSHRDELNGTWFIQTLCDKIKELAPKEDLESIITEVKRDVAIEKSLEEYNRRTFDFETNKQIPVIVSTLIRKLYLKRNGDSPEENLKLGDVVTDDTNPVMSSRLPNCLCIFDKFEYLKNCMRYFLEDNEDDVTGKSFLDVAETLSEGYEFHAVKEQLSKAMSNHLMTMAKDCDYYKYLYFYKDGS